MTIFVQIAAYRDAELSVTIQDLISKAKYLDALRIVVCNQGTPGDWQHPILKAEQVRSINVPFDLSQGVCWARSQVQQHYEGETYALQLDSHHRFVNRWDAKLIDMLERTGSAAPILSTYLPHYSPEDMSLGKDSCTPGKQVFSHFDHDGIVHFRFAALLDDESMTPSRARFISGHFVFYFYNRSVPLFDLLFGDLDDIFWLELPSATPYLVLVPQRYRDDR